MRHGYPPACRDRNHSERPRGRLFHATLTDQRDVSEAKAKLKLENTKRFRNNKEACFVHAEILNGAFQIMYFLRGELSNGIA